ncbi:MAG: carbohydrate ABC transporter permease [Oscillospiraceae bacterium]
MKNIRGYGFTALWAIGTFIWFVIPALTSLGYSFRKVNPNDRMTGEWLGIKNYIYAFTEDGVYTEKLFDSLCETILVTPLTVIFSLFIAVLLNRDFRGKRFVSAIFFLPVIIASGAVYEIISGDISKAGAESGIQFSSMFSADIDEEFFRAMGIYDLAPSLISLIENISERIIGLIWYSGIQILVFLLVLRTIPPSAREIAYIEGATEWEYFWKVLIPYVQPAIIANTVFTAVDTFTHQDNAVIRRILDMQAEWNYGKASAMAWAYFFAVLIFTAVILFIFSRIFRWEK